MSSLNKVSLIGNLGADPETRTTGSGSVVANLRVATNERRKAQGSDEWEDHTEWHAVVCFGKLAENVGQYLRKGRQVYVEGKLRTRKWQDKDGNDRWTTEIWADVVLFLGGAPGEDREESREEPREERRGSRRDQRDQPGGGSGYGGRGNRSGGRGAW